MAAVTIYLLSHIIIGFTLGCFNYFRNKATDIAAIAELVAILLVWPLLGAIYIIVEFYRVTFGGDSDDRSAQ